MVPTSTSTRADETDDGALSRRQRTKRNTRAVTALMIGSTLRMFGVALRNTSETEIWFRAYDGDFAAQVAAQSLLESCAGAFGFLLNPIAGGLSDAFGRKRVMLVSPIFMMISASLIAWRPTVLMLTIRRFLMPLSSQPWHTGEQAALADMFKDDSAQYAEAKSRVSTLQSATSIGIPIVGGWLGQKDIRLPWAIAAAVHLLQTLICALYLEETLPLDERLPFRWKQNNPLSFLKLFCRGRKLRLVAVNSIWSSLAGRYSTYRYASVHRQQLLNWDLNQRGRYESFSGLFEVGGSYLSGKIISALGTSKSLYLGYLSGVIQQLSTGLASRSWHFYAVRSTQLTSDVSMVAMQYTQTAVGHAVGMAQGELVAAISNLGTIVRVFTPLVWGSVYNYGLRHNMPSLIYFVSAASGSVQLLLVRAVIAAPVPAELKLVKEKAAVHLVPKAEELDTPRSLRRQGVEPSEIQI